MRNCQELRITILKSVWMPLLHALSFKFSRFKTFGASDPHRPPEDVAFSVARFFQKGGSLQNYYMVHSFLLDSNLLQPLRQIAVNEVLAFPFSIMVGQTLDALQADHSLPQVMIMMHQLMNMVSLGTVCNILSMVCELTDYVCSWKWINL